MIQLDSGAAIDRVRTKFTFSVDTCPLYNMLYILIGFLHKKVLKLGSSVKKISKLRQRQAQEKQNLSVFLSESKIEIFQSVKAQDEPKLQKD